MSLPIDEILSDLREVLETHEAHPDDESMQRLTHELRRIADCCEAYQEGSKHE